MTIEPTIRLYKKNAYQKEFEAYVIKIVDNNVYLNQTCFYPESGGQAGDKGLIKNQKVIDTKFDSDKNIFHIMEVTPDMEINEKVFCSIDWERRYKIMKIHSASHIMEHFLFKVFGKLKLLGSNLNETRDSSTYASEIPLDLKKIKEVEDLSNNFIKKNLPIETFEDPKKPHFLWWKCSDILIPCGGTHPLNTSEIGEIFLKREKAGKNKEKIYTFLK